MILATLIVASVNLGAGLAALWILTRATVPKSRRADERETARRAWLAAEHLYPGGEGPDKARAATQHILDTHPKMTPMRARMLLEAAHAEATKE